MRRKKPDQKNAQSLIDASEQQMNFTITLPVTVQAGSTIVRNIYESFRMLGDALLVSKGFKSDDHLVPITELMKLEVETSRPIQLLDNMRKFRHNINYYGYQPRIEEITDVVSFADACYKPILSKVKELVNYT